MRPPSRRSFLAGATAAVAVGCNRSAPEGPSLLDRLAAAAPDEVPAVMIASGADPTQLARAGAWLALQRCSSASVDGSGMVSHAFLGIAAALELSATLPAPRARAPVLAAIVFAAREAQHSPYVDTPWRLPAPSAPAPDLAAAIAQGDVAGADGWVHAHPGEAGPRLAQAATAHLGHLGHRAIFVAAARILGDRGLWRGPARYLASHRPTDDTEGAVAAARAGILAGSAGAMAHRLAAGARPEELARSLVDEAVTLASSGPTVHAQLAHLVTWTRAVQLLLPIHPDPAGAVLAAAVWLDRVRAGTTELGVLTHRSDPPAPRSGSAADLLAAVRAGDEAAAEGLALTVVPTPDLWAELVDHAGHAAALTIQHAMKLIASAPDTPAGRGLVCRYLARSQGGPDPAYTEILERLRLR